jgi:hypothetical protein
MQYSSEVFSAHQVGESDFTTLELARQQYWSVRRSATSLIEPMTCTQLLVAQSIDAHTRTGARIRTLRDSSFGPSGNSQADNHQYA